RVQLKSLYENVFKVVKYFHSKTNVRLFPDISPELYCGEYDHYVFQLDLENTHKLTKNNIKEKITPLLKKIKKLTETLIVRIEIANGSKIAKMLNGFGRKDSGK
ncbi:MAG: hypothetical protein Q8M94_03995, partial [Ignavibacteria bacterium]|nr:hypothetical protein [Ignavibacteria bacterium]